MFKKDTSQPVNNSNSGGKNVESLIAKDMVLTGEVASVGSIRVDGLINGTMSVEGTLLIGKEGVVKGILQATSFVLAGTFEGNAKVKEKIIVHPTGRLFGDIVCQSLVMEDGGFFQGNCVMASETQVYEQPLHEPIIVTEKETEERE